MPLLRDTLWSWLKPKKQPEQQVETVAVDAAPTYACDASTGDGEDEVGSYLSVSGGNYNNIVLMSTGPMLSEEQVAALAAEWAEVQKRMKADGVFMVPPDDEPEPEPHVATRRIKIGTAVK